MTRYELIVDVNGYAGVYGLSTINIVNGGYGWSVGSTFSIGTGGSVGVVTTLSTATGTSFLVNIDALGPGDSISAASTITTGIGYTVGEYLYLLGGSTNAVILVNTINGSGGILTYTFITTGAGYTLNDSASGQPTPSVTSATVIISGLGYTTGTYTTSGVGFLLTISEVSLNIIRNQYLDTYDDIGIALNYQISDISDISTSNTSYSKTINLPDTKVNRTTFEYIFGLNSYSDFDPTKKSRCWIIKDTSTQFTGYIQLTNIIYDRKTNKNEYQVNIYADNDTLWTNIGEKFLTDLNLNSYSHTYSNTNIVNSWSRDYSSGYYYPLIDYVGNMDYNLVSGASSSLTVFSFKPAIYTKVILDQIFTDVGYTYTSDFLNSSLFKNLIIPFNNASVTPYVAGLTTSTGSIIGVTLSNTLFAAYNSGTVSATLGWPTTGTSSMWTSMSANIEAYDPNGFYTPSTHYYTNTFTPYAYGQRFRVDFNILFDDYGSQLGDDLWIVIKRSQYADGSAVSGWSDTPSYFNMLPAGAGAWPYVPINGNSFGSLLQSGSYTVNSLGGNTYSVSGTIYSDYLTGTVLSSVTGNFFNTPIRPGEQVRFFVMRYAFLSTLSPTPRLRLYPGNIISSELNTNIMTYNSLITMNNIVSNNIKQRDFLSSIIKMFNLYIEPDKLNSNNFRIEPRDNYYSKYKVIKNWSKKLDVSQPIDSQIASNTQMRKNIFSYKTDKDFYNTTYTNETSQIFGQYEWDIDNDFISSEKKIEPIFSPTPLDQLVGNNNIYLPTITNNSSSAATSNGMNIRILYKNVLTLSGNNQLYFNSSTYSFYPYAGPFDNPLNPTISLNFGQVAAFYPSFNDTVNNLFFGYWQDTMQELSEPTSRIITAYFYLNSVDISQFYFSDLIFFTLDGQDGYYRVNKIIDYDPSSTNSTKVELLKTKYYSAN